MPKSEIRKKRLEFLMKRQGYTFKGLGDALGVSEKTLRNYRDGGNLSLNTLIDLADVFDVSTDFLIGAKIIDDNDLNLTAKSDVLYVLRQSKRIITEQNELLSHIANLVSNESGALFKPNEVENTEKRLSTLIDLLNESPKKAEE